MFECDTGRQRVAVCAAVTNVQYRAGRPGHIALASPPRSAGLSYANRPYSGGGEAQVTFANGRYAYTVYSNVIRTSFGADGRHDPAFGAGVIVTRDGRPLSARRCVAPADATLDLTLATKRLAEGNFVEHD